MTKQYLFVNKQYLLQLFLMTYVCNVWGIVCFLAVCETFICLWILFISIVMFYFGEINWIELNWCRWSNGIKMIVVCTHFYNDSMTEHGIWPIFSLEFRKIEHTLLDFGYRNTGGQGNFLFWQISNGYFEKIGTEFENWNGIRKSYPLGSQGYIPGTPTPTHLNYLYVYLVFWTEK